MTSGLYGIDYIALRYRYQILRKCLFFYNYTLVLASSVILLRQLHCIVIWNQICSFLFSKCFISYILFSFNGFYLLYSSASVFDFCSLHVHWWVSHFNNNSDMFERFSSVLLLHSSLIIFKIFMIKKCKQILTLIRTFMRYGLWRKLIFVQYNNDFNIALFRTSTKLFQQQKMINGSL